MSAFYWQGVKLSKRGALWPDGSSRLCTACAADPESRRSRQATVTAELRRRGSRFRVPVAYCEPHVPEEIR